MNNEFTAQGIVASKDQKPLVDLHWGEQRGQLTPGEATQMGLRIIMAAIEAERDAGLLHFTLETMNGDYQAAGALLSGVRKHREQWDPTNPVEPEAELRPNGENV